MKYTYTYTKHNSHFKVAGFRRRIFLSQIEPGTFPCARRYSVLPSDGPQEPYREGQCCRHVGVDEGRNCTKKLCGRGFCRHRGSSADPDRRPPLIARKKNHEKSVCGLANFCFSRGAKFPAMFFICSGRKFTRFPIHFSIGLSEKFQLRCFRSPPAVGGQVCCFVCKCSMDR